MTSFTSYQKLPERCDKHGKLCFIKTGTKEGSGKGKSFFICSEPKDTCKYAKPALEWRAELCPKHEGVLIELRLVVNRETDYRKYYRCVSGKAEGHSWCGYSLITIQPAVVKKTSNDDDLLEALDASLRRLNIAPQSNNSDKSQSPESGKFVGDYHCDISDTSNPNASPNVQTSSNVASELPSTCAETCPSNEIPLKGNANSSMKEDTQKPTNDGNESQVNCGREANEDSTSQKSSSTGKIPASPDKSSDNATKYKHIKGIKVVRRSKGEGSSNNSSSPSPEQAKVDTTSECSADISAVASPPSNSKTTEALKEECSKSDNYKQIHEKDSSLTPEALNTSDKGKDCSKESSCEAASLNDLKSQSKLSNGDGEAADLTETLDSIKSELSSLQKKLQKQKNFMKSLDMDTLPDGGLKLKNQSESLEMQIASMKIRYEACEKNSRSKHILSEAVPRFGEQAVISSPRNIRVFEKPRTTSAHQPPKLEAQATDRNQPAQFGSVGSASADFSTVTSKGARYLDEPIPLPLSVLQQMYRNSGATRGLTDREEPVSTITAEAVRKLHEQLQAAPEAEVCEQPEGLCVDLMKHQLTALRWLMWREQQETQGGILADDMGLGKTLTMISLIVSDLNVIRDTTASSSSSDETGASAHEETKERIKKDDGSWLSTDKETIKTLGSGSIQSKATLVVCPASVVHQWEKEVHSRTSPPLSVCVYHGPNRERHAQRLADHDVVITTYKIVSMELFDEKENKGKEKCSLDKRTEHETVTIEAPNLLRVAWRRVILDEGHVVKNPKSQMSLAACRLRADRRWVVTGTPLQNELADIYALIRFLRCAPFDEIGVWKKWVDNKTKKGEERLSLLVKTLLLRRTKTQQDSAGRRLVPLPVRQMRHHKLRLSSAELELYKKIYAESKSFMEEYLKYQRLCYQRRQLAKPPPGSAPVPPSKGKMLLSLLRLRQCCTHPALLGEIPPDEASSDIDVEDQMELLSLEGGNDFKRTSDARKELFDRTYRSCKVRALVHELEQIRSSDRQETPQKCVLVSQWTSLLDLIAIQLDSLKVRHMTISGRVNAKARSQIVENFNNNPKGPPVLLLSLQAGGVGLNLIGGNHLFLLDLHWNPSLEMQAFDRIYRVGQQKDVTIHRFLCEDTIEEKILDLQKQKLRLADNILTGKSTQSHKLQWEDLKLMFGL